LLRVESRTGQKKGLRLRNLLLKEEKKEGNLQDGKKERKEKVKAWGKEGKRLTRPAREREKTTLTIEGTTFDTYLKRTNRERHPTTSGRNLKKKKRALWPRKKKRHVLRAYLNRVPKKWIERNRSKKESGPTD